MWTALGLLLLCIPALIVLGLMTYVYCYVQRNQMENLVRAFQERPLFIIPRGERDPSAEEVRFPTADGMTLHGAYFKAAPPRKGVIVFGIEYGSDLWASRPYCDALIQAGYDVFAYEPRNQGESDTIPNFEPLQWITEFEIADARAAVQYMQTRADADPKGFGWFGVSKGANAGLALMSDSPHIRCGVTDGAFGLVSVITLFMRRWINIYNPNYLTHGLLPGDFYRWMCRIGIRRVEKQRRVRFYHVENRLRRIRQPLLMIHGASDTYISELMARTLFDLVRGPKEFWLVPNARHNQAINVAGAEYTQRVVAFFDQHLR